MTMDILVTWWWWWEWWASVSRWAGDPWACGVVSSPVPCCEVYHHVWGETNTRLLVYMYSEILTCYHIFFKHVGKAGQPLWIHWSALGISDINDISYALFFFSTSWYCCQLFYSQHNELFYMWFKGPGHSLDFRGISSPFLLPLHSMKMTYRHMNINTPCT